MAVKITTAMLPNFGTDEKGKPLLSLKEAQTKVDSSLDASAKMLEVFRKKHKLPQVKK